MRGRAPGFLRRPGGRGTIVLERVVPGIELRWLDVAQGLTAGIALENAGEGRTRATAYVEGPAWRLWLEGAQGAPRQALSRLHDLCQTASNI